VGYLPRLPQAPGWVGGHLVHRTPRRLDLFGQAVDPFFEDVKHKLKLGLEAEALEICKGIVLGLYGVRDDEGGELLRWVPEFPEESAGWAADIWRAACHHCRRRSIPWAAL
jgi:hypothetical protein